MSFMWPLYRHDVNNARKHVPITNCTLTAVLSVVTSVDDSTRASISTTTNLTRHVPIFTARFSTRLNAIFFTVYAERGYEIVCRLSVCLPVRDVEVCFHTVWDTSKIISRPNTLRSLLTLTPIWAIWCYVNTPKLGWNKGGARST